MSRVILDLCGGTGAWSKPYREAGYDVELIDINNGQDVRLFKKPSYQVYGILASPPCTHLASSGARWWKDKGESALLEALSIVDACLRIVSVTQPKFWCLENPVGRLVRYLGRPRLYFQPCDYGDAYTKKTCLWGEFNVPKTTPVECSVESQSGYSKLARRFPSKMHLLPSTGDRPMLRGITPGGFARAFFEANR